MLIFKGNIERRGCGASLEEINFIIYFETLSPAVVYWALSTGGGFRAADQVV